MEKQYEEKTRKPFYLYTGVILIGCLIVWGFLTSMNAQQQKRTYVQHPQPGDVYTIREESGDSTGYYFLRVSRINGDTVFTWHNTLVYSRHVFQLSPEDFFTKEEELFYTKQELIQLQKKDDIYTVYRNYGTKEGFDRVR